MMPTRLVYVASLVLCAVGTQAKPSLSLNFPALAIFGGGLAGGARQHRQAPSSLKRYTGKRLRNDSLLMTYFHDQTVAVVELGPKKLLLNCELLEVYESDEALGILSDLEKSTRPLYISLQEMLTLMSQCQQVDAYLSEHEQSHGSSDRSKAPINSRGILSNNPLTLFSGIIPGTKWCGTGDIATDYFDLGAEPNVDRCCRAHDLCPVKVRAYSTRYNLTNNSLYTKSHCKCDDLLYECLKESDSPTAHIMGNLYFNLIQVPCVEEVRNGRRDFRSARSNF